MRNESKQFLKAYLDNVSPTGFEYSGQKIWLDYLKPYVDEHFVDVYGTAVGVINPGKDYKVVLEAHADEISWFVNYINDQGLIYLKRNGGVDHQIAPAKRVWIHGKKGPVKAVFGWPAIHTRLGNPDTKEPQPKVDNLCLDCGARTKKEVEDLGIHIGSVVTYEEGFDELANGYYIGRAFDNRIGGFMILTNLCQGTIRKFLRKRWKECSVIGNPISLFKTYFKVCLHGRNILKSVPYHHLIIYQRT